MAVYEVVTLQGEAVLRDGEQVVIGAADPVVVTRSLWGGQSPGTVWVELDRSDDDAG